MPDGERSLDYEAFKHVVREAGERRVAQGGLVPIPELRRQVPALDRRAFDDYVLTLHREGAIHLELCVVHPTGTLLYWLRWL